MEKELNLGFTVKTMLDIFTLSAFTEKNGDKYYEASKKKFHRMRDYSLSKMNDAELKKYEEFIKEIDEWASWAKKKGYLRGYQQTAISDFFRIMTDVALWDMPLDQNMAEHFICYALAKVLYQQVQEYRNVNPDDDKYWAMYWTMANYDFFLSDENYETDISPIQNCLVLFESWVKDMNKIINFWEEKLESKDCYFDLKLYLKRWKSGVVPEWKNVKLFLDEGLCPPDDYFVDDEQIKEKSQYYKSFRANLFMSYTITNMFESFVKRGIITEDSRKMIRNGVRLFYRDFYIIRDKKNKEYSKKLEPEAKRNLMFRTMFCMLDGTLSEVDTVQYMKRIEQNPKYPIVGNTWLDVLRSIFYRQDI